MIALVMAFALVSGAARAQGDAPTISLSDLDAVKALYTAAAYEDTLQRVAKIAPAELTVFLEQYRALSLLALGRGPEAEQAFERMVRLAPLYRIPDADVSPRVSAMFKAVRQRVLPSVARDLYEAGRASYDQKQFAEASGQLTQLISVLADADVEGKAELDDLKLLADGFVRLAELEATMAARVAAAASVAAAPTPAGAAAVPVTPTRQVIYSASDSSVLPPVPTERRMPPWVPSSVMARNVEYNGTIELIVSETGAVESAGMARPTVPPYDQALLAAAKNWKFKPATQNGRPVRYRISYSIDLAPGR